MQSQGGSLPLTNIEVIIVKIIANMPIKKFSLNMVLIFVTSPKLYPDFKQFSF
jgi:hypothetical protein